MDVPVGTVVVPKSSIAITRNYDFDFGTESDSNGKPYLISKPVSSPLTLVYSKSDLLLNFRLPPILSYTMRYYY